MRLKLVALALLSCFALSSLPLTAFAGPEVIFPLSAILPFPWGKIEGIWEADDNGVSALFSFEVQSRDCEARKILKVVRIDPYTGEVLAEGIGITYDNSRIVHAAMRGKQGNYYLSIGAYENKDASLGPNQVTVLTLHPFNVSDENQVQVIVDKVSDIPLRLKNTKQMH